MPISRILQFTINFNHFILFVCLNNCLFKYLLINMNKSLTMEECT